MLCSTAFFNFGKEIAQSCQQHHEETSSLSLSPMKTTMGLLMFTAYDPKVPVKGRRLAFYSCMRMSG